jgi:PhoH-like ATPase
LGVFYGNAEGVPLISLPQIADPLASESVILRNDSKSVLATYRLRLESFVRIEKLTAYGIAPRNADPSSALAALTNHDVSLVTLVDRRRAR